MQKGRDNYTNIVCTLFVLEIISHVIPQMFIKVLQQIVSKFCSLGKCIKLYSMLFEDFKKEKFAKYPTVMRQRENATACAPLSL